MVKRIFLPLSCSLIFLIFVLFRFTVHGSENQYNQGGVAYQPQNLSDISPPVFEKIFKNARFAQGGNALFEGKLRANPKPVVSWKRKGAPLLASNKYRINYNETTGDVSTVFPPVFRSMYLVLVCCNILSPAAVRRK